MFEKMKERDAAFEKKLGLSNSKIWKAWKYFCLGLVILSFLFWFVSCSVLFIFGGLAVI